MQARVTGTLGINGAGCFTLGGMVMVAPHNSRVLGDGEGIWIGQLIEQELRIGDQFLGSGGYLPADEWDIEGPWQKCLAEVSEVLVIVQAGLDGP
jgi:hypothetical protein